MKRSILNRAQILTSLALAFALVLVVNASAHAQTLNIVTKTSTVQIKTADIDSATVQTTTLTIIKKDKTTQVIAIADIQRMTFTLATGVAGASSFNTSNSAALSGLLGLVKAYPNPASGMNTTQYELSQPASVEARIVDAAGNLVKTIVVGMQSAGTHEVQWDATNSAGATVANGSYTCVIRTSSGAMLTQKLMIVR